MSAQRLLSAILFAAVCAGYLSLSWSTVLGEFGGDNAQYLLMAQHFSPYSPTSPIADYFFHQSIYPPLFPLMLGLIGGGDSLLAAHLATTGFLLATFGLFFWWLRTEGLSALTASFSTLSFAILPGVYLQTLSIHSENLYLLCSIAAFASAAKTSRESHAWLAITGIAIIAAYFTRGAGLALIAAWLSWIWLNQLPNRLTYTLAATLPVLLWNMYGGTVSNNYWQQLTHGYHNPGELLGQLQSQTHYLLVGWQSNFGSGHTAWIAGNLLLVAGLIAALWRTWLKRLDAFYVWCYLGMIVLWPFPAEAQRMVLVLLPILLGQTIWMLNKWRLKTYGTRPLQLMALMILMLASLPELALNTQRLLSPLPTGVPEPYRHTEAWYSPDLRRAIAKVQISVALESHLVAINTAVPQNVCIFAIKPSVVGYLSHRISKTPPAISVDDINFKQAIDQQRCQYFYMLGFLSPSFPKVMYPYERIHEQLEILSSATIPGRDGAQIAGALGKLR